MFNHSNIDFEVKVGDRIAQLILEKIVTPNVMEVEDLDATEKIVTPNCTTYVFARP